MRKIVQNASVLQDFMVDIVNPNIVQIIVVGLKMVFAILELENANVIIIMVN